MEEVIGEVGRSWEVGVVQERMRGVEWVVNGEGSFRSNGIRGEFIALPCQKWSGRQRNDVNKELAREKG